MKEFNYPRYFYNDYKNCKEDWELINGYRFQILPISIQKSKTLSNLITQTLSTIQNLNSRKYSAILTFDWKINDDTVIRPDIMIVCGEPKSHFLEMTPVLIIEILSLSNAKTDRVIKFQLYQENGVQFYLMVDPLKKKVEVFELIDNKYQQVDKQKFLIDKNCEIEFDYEKLWK